MLKYLENCEVIYNKGLKYYKNMWKKSIDVYINGLLKVIGEKIIIIICLFVNVFLYFSV